MTPSGNRILVAIDGSERSLLTVKYMTQVPCFRQMEINLFHVFNAIPETYRDLSKEPASQNIVASVRAWEKQQREKTEDHLRTFHLFLKRPPSEPGYGSRRRYGRSVPRIQSPARILLGYGGLLGSRAL
jgi:hypothetical protein